MWCSREGYVQLDQKPFIAQVEAAKGLANNQAQLWTAKANLNRVTAGKTTQLQKVI